MSITLSRHYRRVMRFRCPCCKPNLERRPRSGWFEHHILKLINLHPWECRQCRTRILRRERFQIPSPGQTYQPRSLQRS